MLRKYGLSIAKSHIGNYNVLYIKCRNSTNYYTMSSRVATQLASNNYRLFQIYILHGGPKLTAKTGPAWPILVAKVVRGTSFGKIFCQNWSGRTDFRGIDIGVTGLSFYSPISFSFLCVAVSGSALVFPKTRFTMTYTINTYASHKT